MTTYYNEAYGRQVAKFNNTWAGSTTGYYKVDYADNEAEGVIRHVCICPLYAISRMQELL